VREGEEAASMFLLLRGRVEVRTEEGGVRLRLGTLGPGDCFGEMGILDLQPRSASVVALEPSEALELSSMAIHGLYEHDLEQFALLWMNLARELSRRLRQADLDRARAAGDSP
jgi:CRP/FNR family transcriptional regulator, cyclic AMP receptor protein